MERGTRQAAAEAAGAGATGETGGTQEKADKRTAGAGNFTDQRRKDDADSGGDSRGEEVLRRECV